MFNSLQYLRYSYTVIFLASLLTACSSDKSAIDYFPTQADITWLYSGYQNNWRLVNNDFLHIIHNTSYEQTGSGEGVLIKTRHDGSQLTYHIQQQGISHRYDPLNQTDSHENIVLPGTLSKNHKWKKNIRTRLIPEFACGYCTTTTELRQPIQLNLKILSTNATVNTPIGKFKDCILIEGHGIETIDAGDSMGKVDVEVHTREWYAPNTGLVKLEWREQTNEDILKIGEYKLELKDIYYN